MKESKIVDFYADEEAPIRLLRVINNAPIPEIVLPYNKDLLSFPMPTISRFRSLFNRNGDNKGQVEIQPERLNESASEEDAKV